MWRDLDLGHGWTLASTGTATEAAAHVHGSERQRGDEGGEEEPEESSARL